jgi:hypothetical protein
MAKVQHNAVIKGVSGTLGDQLIVKRDKAGRSILCKKPTFAEDRKFSEAQKEQQGSFREAMLYAKSAVKTEPIYAEMAEGTPRTTYNVAITDWFHPPEIRELDLRGWSGQAGQSIHIEAVDDVKVAGVTVPILDEEAELIEQGEAEQVNELWWVYTTTQAAPERARAIAVARDLPGNIGQGAKEKQA